MRPRTARLPIFLSAFLCILSASAAADDSSSGLPSSSPAAKANALLHEAVRNIEAHSSISARLRHETDLFDRHLVGSGTYREVRGDDVRKMRLEIRTQLGEQTSSLVQVCDGKYLWIHANLPSEAKLGRVDAAVATRAIQKAAREGAAPRPGAIPSLGGLAGLLRGIDAAFDFAAAEAGHWGKEKLPVWRLQGQWKRSQLLRLLPHQKEAIEGGEPPDLGKLAEHLPDHVVLLLRQEDLFPCRVEYRRGPADKATAPGAANGRALVTMDLFEIFFDGRIDPSYFLYSPGDIEIADRTSEFLRSLGVTP